MTWVKICGLTVAEDVAAAVAAGADAVGFVVDPSSPRAVTFAQVEELASGVPVTTVLVGVDLPSGELLEVVRATGVTAVQPYGVHAASATVAALEAGLVVLRPVPMTPAGDAPELDGVPDGAIPLLDTFLPGRNGGTGVTFAWDRVGHIGRRFVVAGGLGPDNVVAAIAATGAWGVDASSRLEREPGIKDHGKVAAFVEEAKRS